MPAYARSELELERRRPYLTRFARLRAGWFWKPLGRRDPAPGNRRKSPAARAAAPRSNVELGQVAIIAGARDFPPCPLRPPVQAAAAPAVSKSRSKTKRL